MKIGIIDADLLGRDKHHFPNLACEKISGYWKAQGAEVKLLMDYTGFEDYDHVYVSKVFTDTPVPIELIESDKLHIGGTGFYFDKAPNLPDEIEHHMPDYRLYDEWIENDIKKAEELAKKKNKEFNRENYIKRYREYTDYAIGFMTRGCFRKCPFCVNQKFDHVFEHSPLEEFYYEDCKRVCLLDDNFLGCPNWRELLEQLIKLKKPFKFKQGLDERLLTEEKCKILFSANYDGDYTFAFDNVSDYELIHSKLKMIRKYTKTTSIKFYVLVGFESTDYIDIENAFKRIELLMRFKCLPYVMRYQDKNYSPWKESKYRSLYVTMARWGNQPSIFKKMSFRQFCEANQALHKTEGTMEICNSVICKNKESAKYIPDIFIEEGYYKENLRYFSLPLPFVNKIIEDLNSMDFNKVNTILEKEQIQKIQFLDCPRDVSADNYDSVINHLKRELKRCVSVLEQIDDKSRGGDTIEERYTQGLYLNNSLKWNLKDMLEQLEFLSYRVLLLTRNAGQGKTNFVCDFTENFLVKRGILSVYFNAADFCETPSAVIKRLFAVNGAYDEDYAFAILTEIWKKTKIPFVIVIDGLNENTSLPNFENHIKQSIDELIQMPFVKVIMTTRNELLEERFGRLTQENFGTVFFRMDMSGRREERFGERIFEGYLKYFDVDIVRESLLDSTYELLTNDTLLLRFFCEVNRGKKQVYMYDVYKYSLFNQYYENKKSEMGRKNIPGGDALFEQLVNTICEYMVENKVFNNVPRDVLNINEIQLLDILLEADVIFKEDQVVKKGFFNGYTEVLSFTFDEFRDFCITKYLLQKPDAQQSFPVVWEAMCNEHFPVL